MPLAIFTALLMLIAGLLGWRLFAHSRRRASTKAFHPTGDAHSYDSDAHWGTFLVNMSHELRTPLNGVIGFTELLLEADLPEQQHQQARLIAESGRAMLRLLNDILDIARIEAGQLRLVTEVVDLREELEHCLSLMQPIAVSRGLELTLTSDDALPARLQFDRLRLRQVVLGLIGNALKFTELGSVSLSADIADGQVQIAICDTGTGIAHERHASLFTPFSGNDAGPRPFGGSGLGLAMADRIVRMMGGAISVESAAGQGSTFTVTLPLHPATALSVVEPTAQAIPPRELTGMRVLIAEDHEINQQLIMAMADNLQLDATLVGTGREAVNAVIEAEQTGIPYQLVLMDVQMPDMDGLEAAQALREAGFSPADLPIIALTANCFAADIAAARAAGMQAHLPKPIMLADLACALAEHGRVEPTQGATNLWTDNVRDVLRQPGGVSAALHTLDHRYRQRKQALIYRVEAALVDEPDETDWAAIRSGLHKLAGVAANFGEGPLGELSRQLENRLKVAALAEQRQRLLAEHWPDWQAAA